MQTQAGTKVVVINKPMTYNKKRYSVGDVFDTLHPLHTKALKAMFRVTDYSEKEVALDNFERNLKSEFMKIVKEPEKEIEEPEPEKEIEEPELFEMTEEADEEISDKAPTASEFEGISLLKPNGKPKSRAQLRRELLASQISED